MSDVIAILQSVFYPARLAVGAVLLLILLRFLPIKGLWRKLILAFVLGQAATATIWLGDAYNILGCAVMIIPAVCLLCGGRVLARASMGVILFSLLISVTALGSALRPPLDDYGDLCVLLFYVTVLLAVRRFIPLSGVEGLRSTRLWLLLDALAAMPFLSTLFIVILTTDQLVNPGDDPWIGKRFIPNEKALLIVIALAALTSLAVLIAAVVLARHETLERERALWESQERYYAGIEENQRQVRLLRHDMANHLQVMSGLSDAAMRVYLDGLIASPAMRGGQRFCENEVANAALSAKIPAAKEKEISVECDVSLPAGLPIADADLCAIFANCLDNAIEASLKLPPERRQIKLNARAEAGLFMLRAENAMEGKLVTENGIPRTRKANPEEHGFGLAGIFSIAKRHRGIVKCGQSGGSFELLISIPLDMSVSSRSSGIS
jgi:hypothetical protein